jgi:hypothetical protein
VFVLFRSTSKQHKEYQLYVRTLLFEKSVTDREAPLILYIEALMINNESFLFSHFTFHFFFPLKTNQLPSYVGATNFPKSITGNP